MEILKVVFDSNVWRIIAIPEDFPDEPFLDAFKKIHQAIINKKIEVYLSETIFTIEAIRKVERQDFFSSVKAKVIVTEEFQGDSIRFGFTIGPNEKDAIDFNERPILKRFFDEAIRLGFRIVRLSIVGGLVNKDVDSVRFKLEGEELSKYLNKVF